MAWTRRTVVGTLVVVACLLASACGDDDTTDTADSDVDAAATVVTDPTSTKATEPMSTEAPATEPPATEPAATEPPATEPPPTGTTAADAVVGVNVYWAWEILDPPVCCAEKIGAGGRWVEGPAVARAALEAMLWGPHAVESEIGMLTTIPDGTRLLDLAVADGVATVDLSAEFEESSGSLVERFRVAQVVFTLTQFDNIERVLFRIDGVDRDEIMSHGIPVRGGVTRDDDPDLRPGILVEHPYPGAEVADPLVLRGESNTFEATVQYVVTAGGGDGIVLTEGFTTATDGNGRWGTFEASIDLDTNSDAYRAGPGSVVVFETSPEDGSMVNVVEYPITLPATASPG